MTRDELERLAGDPSQTMTKQEQSQLRRLRAADTVQHDTEVPRHPTDFDKHATKPRKMNDGQTH